MSHKEGTIICSPLRCYKTFPAIQSSYSYPAPTLTFILEGYIKVLFTTDSKLSCSFVRVMVMRISALLDVKL